MREQLEKEGYTADGEPVGIQVTPEENNIEASIQSVTEGWSIKQEQVL